MLTCLLWNTLVACILAGIVFGISLSKRISPAMRHALWLVVVLKLLSPIGLIWEIQLPWPTTSEPATEGIAMNVEVPPRHEDRSELLAVPPREVFAPIEGEVVSHVVVFQACEMDLQAAVKLPENGLSTDSTPGSTEPTRSPFPWGYWLLIAWGAGALWMMWTYGIQTLRFARYVQRGTPANGWLTRQVAAMAEKIGVRVPVVRVVAGLPSPVVWCLWRPVLLWPKGLENQLTQEGRNTILTHELAHLRRRDHWVRWLELFAAVVHWWNPLFRYARRQLRFHAELACDAWVLGTLPENRRAYAEALLDVCQRSVMPAAPTPAVGVGGEGKKMLERRLTMIMQERVPCRAATGARLFVCLLAMAAIPAWTLGQSKPETKPEPKPEKKLILGDDIQIEIVGDGDLKALLQKVEALRQAEAQKKPQPQDAEIKAIEAKIAELTAQLSKLKAVKAQPTETKKPVPAQATEPAKPLPPKEAPTREVVLKLLQNQKDGNQPTVIVIGPDGKEIKDAKILAEFWKAPIGLAAPAIPPAIFDKAAQAYTVIGEMVDGKIQYKAVGPDGKSIKDWKPAEHVKPVEGYRTTTIPAFPFGNSASVRSTEPSSASKVVSLTRATYKLPKEKAEAVANVLKEIKATVMETKIDADGLTVTTTPEVQRTVEAMIKLLGNPPTTGGSK